MWSEQYSYETRFLRLEERQLKCGLGETHFNHTNNEQGCVAALVPGQVDLEVSLVNR